MARYEHIKHGGKLEASKQRFESMPENIKANYKLISEPEIPEEIKPKKKSKKKVADSPEPSPEQPTEDEQPKD